jgi:hypothetical protein
VLGHIFPKSIIVCTRYPQTGLVLEPKGYHKAYIHACKVIIRRSHKLSENQLSGVESGYHSLTSLQRGSNRDT